ncbi:MAG: hypothetical protein LDL33_00805 [Desulfomonile sp.]|nr:hypothetical protein [Desulfomonile sp.]
MKYTALLSSDWNECLAPSGPFDPIAFSFPGLAPELTQVFHQYTSNEITLSEATGRIAAAMPGPITEDDMDAYLAASFSTYRGVADLIEWCLSHDILFMINTTGMQGYFQRVFAKKLVPAVPVAAANPLIRFAGADEDPRYSFLVRESDDKPKNTEAVLCTHGIPPERAIVIGDSGGDGPHFEWGSKVGAFRIAGMTKPSLVSFCKNREIIPHMLFGITYELGEARDLEREMGFYFNELSFLIEAFLELRSLEGS